MVSQTRTTAIPESQEDQWHDKLDRVIFRSVDVETFLVQPVNVLHARVEPHSITSIETPVNGLLFVPEDLDIDMSLA